MVYDPVGNFGPWADANFGIDPDTILSVSGNVNMRCGQVVCTSAGYECPEGKAYPVKEGTL